MEVENEVRGQVGDLEEGSASQRPLLRHGQLRKPHMLSLLSQGSAALFDSRLLHCGGANRSNRPRVIFYFTIAADNSSGGDGSGSECESGNDGEVETLYGSNGAILTTEEKDIMDAFQSIRPEIRGLSLADFRT